MFRPEVLAPRALAGALVTVASGQLALFVSGILTARMLGAEDRGHFAIITLAAVIVIQLGLAGLPVSLTYQLARGRSAVGTVTQLSRTMILQAALLPVVAGFVLILATRHSSRMVQIAALLSIPVVSAGVAQNYALSVVQGLRDYRALNVLRTLPAAVNTVLIVAVYLAGQRSLVAVTVALVAANVFVALLCVLVAVKRVRRQQETSNQQASLHELRVFGLKALLGSTSPVDSFRLDQAVVGLLLTSRALGVYVVALAFTNLPRFIAQAVSSIAYPQIASRGTREGRLRAMWQFVALGVVACAAVVLLLEVTVPWLVVTLFGREFDQAVEVTRILLLSGFFAALRKILADGTQGTGHPLLGSIAEVTSWFVLVPALLALIPIYGLDGAAAAMALAYGASFLVLLTQAIRLTTASRARTTSSRASFMRLGISVVAASLVAGSSIAILSPSWNIALLLAISLVLITGLMIRRSREGRLDLFEPLTIFVLAWFVMFVMRPLWMLVSNDFTLLTYDTRGGFTKMLALALLGAIGFVAAYLSKRPAQWAQRRRALPKISSYSVVIPYAIGVLLAALALYALFLMRAGGAASLRTLIAGRSGAEMALYQTSTAYLYSAILFATPASLLLIDVGQRRKDRLLIAGGVTGLVPVLLLGATTGTRSSLLPILAALWMLPYLRRGTRPSRKTAVIVAFVVLTVGISFVGSSRGVTGRSHEGLRSSLTSSVLRPDQGIRNLFESGDTEMAPLLSVAVSKVPSTYGFMDGAASGEILVHWVPRALWAGKPRQGDETLSRKLFYETRISQAPRQFSPLANFYLDLGLVGGLVGMALLGLMARAHYEYFIHNITNATVQLLYAATLPFWIVLFRGNLTDTAGRLVFIVPPLLLGIYLGRSREMRQVSPAGSRTAAIAQAGGTGR
jgi:O-antigen/teichoic acid export membrane protein